MDSLGANPEFCGDRRAGNNLRHGMDDSALNSQNYFPSIKEEKWLPALVQGCW